jgi:hypothetical protein
LDWGGFRNPEMTGEGGCVKWSLGSFQI